MYNYDTRLSWYEGHAKLESECTTGNGFVGFLSIYTREQSFSGEIDIIRLTSHDIYTGEFDLSKQLQSYEDLPSKDANYFSRHGAGVSITIRDLNQNPNFSNVKELLTDMWGESFKEDLLTNTHLLDKDVRNIR